MNLHRHLGLGVMTLALSGTAFAAPPVTERPVTFAKDVAPIFQQRCQECHRKGGMAPMSLVTFDEARPWAKSIRERVIKRQMPPWHIDKTVGVAKFKNDISLTDAQIDAIVRWVDAGAPAGDPKDMPAPKQWPNDREWQAAKELNRQPDFVIEAEPYTMPAHNQDVWWRPVANIPITEPRYVRAVEIRPSTPDGRRIVHHAVAYLQQDENALAAASQGVDGVLDRQGVLMEWAIGKSYDLYRPDTGKLLIPGAQISWDLHLHAVGEQIRSGVQLGLWLYPKGQEPPKRTYLTRFPGKAGGELDIPPNTVTENEGFAVLKQAARFESFQPHMHLRGKAMLIEAVLPDGTQQKISYVGNFNFNWMVNYIYEDDAAPVFPKGTMIKVTTWHDNTTANPNNPDAEQWVGYGHRTVDEMAHAWVNLSYLSDEEYSAWAAKHKPPVRRASAER